MEQNDNKEIEMELEGAIEIKAYDITPHIAKLATIEKVTTHYNSNFDSYYLMVKSVPVGYVNNDKEKPVTASKIFGLIKQDGVFGWKKDGDLDLFLKSMECSAPNGLIGKKVVMIPSKPNKDGVRFLSFN